MSRLVAAYAIDVDDDQVTLNMTDAYSDSNAVILTRRCVHALLESVSRRAFRLARFAELIVVTLSHQHLIII